MEPQTTQTKFCPQCETPKPVTDFDFRSGTRSCYLRSYCRSCEYTRLKDWKKRRPEAAARSQKKKDLRLNHGLSLELYEKLVKTQEGKCAICGDECNLHVDHDHKTDLIRGLLCSQCNTALGKFRDSVEILLKAINYLEHNSPIERDLAKFRKVR